MKYQITLPNFEGPLDLLYHLAKKAEVDIYEVSISEITDQYISYIEEWEKFNLEIASEFLVMAARLMELKSKQLLPKTPSSVDEEDEEDPKQQLINQIIEYKFFKEIAHHLKEKENERLQVYWREEAIKPDEKKELKIGELKIHDLLKAIHNVLNKQKKDNAIKNIETKEISISEQKEMLLRLLRCKKGIMFEELFEKISSKAEIIATFLGLLDMVKERRVDISQQDISSPLWINLRNAPK
ncbi:segregation and condensation protein A [Natranaerobius trueperi]|uniref:Segregation and condensation protein A n=1 Tax=Natranaerobius trueperi TaxID=759412 RepID=A0A226BY83_9FIRM|nr:segregation/condensation protein A [Natranaerobius trueperi]OWZ83973.1 segregation/condensation protein A [Natranaerobius trueperi]